MEVSLWAHNGTLTLTSGDSVCSEGGMDGNGRKSINFQGPLHAINKALSGLVYLVRSRGGLLLSVVVWH